MRTHMRLVRERRNLGSDFKAAALCGVRSERMSNCWNNVTCKNCKEANK